MTAVAGVVYNNCDYNSVVASTTTSEMEINKKIVKYYLIVYFKKPAAYTK